MKTNRRDRFERVASKRVQKVIDTLSLISNCSNPNNYEYSEKDVELMFREMNRAIKDAKALFDNELNKTHQGTFKFD